MSPVFLIHNNIINKDDYKFLDNFISFYLPKIVKLINPKINYNKIFYIHFIIYKGGLIYQKDNSKRKFVK